MSKIKEMKITIDELRNTALIINEIADGLAEKFGDVEKKEAKPVLTLEEVRNVLAEKSRNGFTAEIKELLKKYGASKLSEVDPKNYEALLKDTEELNNAT